MADGQELDNLLIKVDSELGDLKGLTSAIDALQRLANFTKDASSGIKQIGQLGKAFHEFDNLKLDGLDEASRGVRNLVGALDDLSKVGNVTKKTFNQFGQLGKTLRDNFDGLGQSLQGIQEVAVGVNNLVSALRGLSQVTGVTKSAINSLGGVGDALHHFNGVDKQIANLVQPVKELMQAIGQLGNNNRVSIRIDNSGIAHVNQVLRNTRRQMTSFNDWWRQLSNDRRSIDLSDMFDISQPTADLERNLSRAQRMIVSYENQTRTSLENLHNLNSMYSMTDLVNNPQFRNAFRSHMISDAMVEQIRQGIDRVSTELETRGAQRIEDAWQHTMDSIAQDSSLDLSELIDTNLPIEQIRTNLRVLQNELSRAESSMQRSWTNLQRLRATEADEQTLRGNTGYRNSYYTYQVSTQYVNQYRQAIDALNASLQEMEHLSQSDVALLRELPQLQQQLTRYQGTLDTLLANDDTSLEGQRTIDAFVRGVDYLEDRIREIQEQLGHVPETTEGVLETMRQVADEAERTARATAETAQNMRNRIGQGFSSFGGMLSGTGNPILGSLGNLSNMFGRAVQSGTARLSEGALASLQGVASTLGTIATAISQVVAVAGVFIAVFKTWWGLMEKIKASLVQFIQGLKQFAKDMLTKVVGAFNAVAGAVSKVASAVRSGAEIVVSALRKIGEFGEKVISVFARFGSFLGTVGKGAKAIANLITPRAVKNLASFNGSLKSIVKNTHLLNKALQVANKWFTMLTRMLMRKIVQAFISSLKQAFEDMVLYEKNANDEMLRLNHNVSIIFSAMRRTGNQLIAIFEPLINAMAVPIESFFTTLTAMGENLAKFMAILTGQPYYLRAKKFYNDYGEEVEDTTKKVKNLTNGLDELNILNDTSSSTEDDKPWDYYFEKVPVDGSMFGLPSLHEILEAIKDWLRNIDWEKIKKIVRDFIHRLMVIINEILKDLELWGLIGDTLAQIFNTLMEAWNQFITDFDPVATEKALSELIVRALNGIDWDLIHENVELTAKKFAQFWNEVFKDEALWDAITKTISNFLNEIVHYFDTWAWTFDFKQMAKTLTEAITNILKNFDFEQLRHAVEGWVTGIVNFINEVIADKEFWKTLGESFAKLVNSTLVEGLKDLTGLDFVGLSDSIKIALTSAIDGIKWEDIKASVVTLAENITKGINDFFGDEEFLTKVTTALANIGNTILSAIKKSLETLNAEDIGNAIGTAIGAGLAKVDWNTVFSLPSTAINKLSEAIKGLLDSIPDDFNLGTWLAEHLKITLDGIDWETIHKNVEDFATKVTEYINGLLADKEFWQKLGGFAGETLDVVWDLTIKPLANVNVKDLVDSIKTAIKEAWDKFNFTEKMGDLGDLTQKIIDAVDYALTTTDWREIGRQIGDGISAFLDKINPTNIAKTIFDAFVALSDSIGGILEKMLEKGDFYKIGQIIANAFYGILGGLAYFLDTNSDEFSKAIDQLAKGISDFLAKHEDEIVMFLNKIIDAIGAILSAKSSARHELVERLANILKKTNLGDLLGIIISGAIKLWIDNMTLSVAVLQGIAQSFGGLVTKVFNALKPYLFNAILSAAFGWFISKLAGIVTAAILGALGVAGLPAIIIGAIVTAIASFLGSLGGWSIAEELKNLFAGWFGKNTDKTANANTEDYKKHWWEFWKEEAPQDVTYEPTVTIDPQIDDSNLEGINWDDYFKDRQNQVIIDDPQFGTITASKIESEIFEGKTLNVDEINAQVLNVVDIFGDKLTVKEIEVTNGTDEVNNTMDKLFAGAPMGAEGGMLSNNAEFEKITAKLLEITEKITAPLLEVSEKVTSPLLEIIEKITAPLLEIIDKITTPLIEVGKIAIKTLNVGNLEVDSLTVDAIIANTLNVADIFANKLRVGEIEGKLSGIKSSTESYPTESFALPNYEGWGNIFGNSDIQKPNFAVGDRWSDISGAVNSAEDFLDDVESLYGNGFADTVTNLMPSYLGGNGGTANDNTLDKEDSNTADAKAMAEAEKALGHNGYGNGGLYDWLQSDENTSSDVKDLSTRLMDAFKQMSEGTFAGGNYTADDVKYGDSLAWSLSDAENRRLRGETTDEEVANRKKKAEDWLNSFENSSQPKKPKEAYEGWDEVNIIGDDTTANENAHPFLANLPLQTEYIMAQVYDIIDKWLGRIWKLFKSFKLPEDIKKLLDGLSGDLGDIELPVLDELKTHLETLNLLLRDLLNLLKQIKNSLIELNTNIKDLIRSLDLLRIAINGLTTDIRSLSESLKGLKEAIDELKIVTEALNRSMDELKNSIDALKDSIDLLKASIDTLRESIDVLRASVDTLTKSADTLVTSVDTLTTSTDLLNETTSSMIDTNESLIDTTETLIGGVDNLNASIVNLGSVVDILTAAINTIVGRIDVLIATINNLIAVLSNLNIGINALKTTIDTLTTAIGNNTSKLESNTNALSELITSINSLKDKLDDVKAEAHASAEAWADSSDDVVDAINGLKDKLENIKCECDCNCCNGCDGKGGKGSGSGSDTHYGGGEDYYGQPTENINDVGGGSLYNPDTGVSTSNNNDGTKETYNTNTGLLSSFDKNGDVTGTFDTNTGKGTGVYDSEQSNKNGLPVKIADTKTGKVTTKDAKGNVTSEKQLGGLWDNKFFDDSGNLVMDFGDNKVASAKGNITLTTKDGKQKTFNLRDVRAIYNQVGAEGLQQVKDRLNNSGGTLSDDYFSGYSQKKTDVKTGIVSYLDASGNVLYERHLDGTWNGVTYKDGKPVNQQTSQTLSEIDSKLANIDIGDRPWKRSNGVKMLESSPANAISSQAEREKAVKKAEASASFGFKLTEDDIKRAGFDSLSSFVTAFNANDKGFRLSHDDKGYNTLYTKEFPKFFAKFKERMLAKGYQMGGIPNSGELYIARENGTNEFIGSFGNKSVVANNEQIVTAVANGVAMANDMLRSSIENQTNEIVNAIDRKDLDVSIGDRQLAKGNRRGEKGLGNKFVE